MSDKTTSHRGAAAAATGAAPAHNVGHRRERREASLSNVSRRWSVGLGKQGLVDALELGATLLQRALELREMQMAAARRAQSRHQKAAALAESARSLPEVANLNLALIQADTEDALRYWADWAGIVARGAVEGWSDSLAAGSRLQSLGGAVSGQWLDAAQAAQPATFIAEPEPGAAAPTAATPFAWPMARAAQDSLTASARTWTDWWNATVPQFATDALQQATRSVTRH